jgi:hypothetical protein
MAHHEMREWTEIRLETRGFISIINITLCCVSTRSDSWRNRSISILSSARPKLEDNKQSWAWCTSAERGLPWSPVIYFLARAAVSSEHVCHGPSYAPCTSALIRDWYLLSMCEYAAHPYSMPESPAAVIRRCGRFICRAVQLRVFPPASDYIIIICLYEIRSFCYTFSFCFNHHFFLCILFFL